MRILVADDDRVVSRLITSLLAEKGHEVTPVFDAMQAVMFAMRAPPPQAIVLDLNMPGGSGLEALRRLKASTKTVNIPVIVLSGSTDAEMPVKVRELGATVFLDKPVDPEALYKALARLPGGSAPPAG